MSDQRFNGKVVVVTGAGSGVGAATASRFGAEGARVACVDQDADATSRTASAIAAAVREHEACIERGLQDRRAVLRRKPVAGVAYRDLMRHRCAG